MSDTSSLPSPNDLTLPDKLAQLIFVRIGSNLPPIRTVDEEEVRIGRLLAECPVGGLLLFKGGVETKATLERLQAATNVPLLIASDIERGVGQQVPGYTLFPHAMAFERQRMTVDWFADVVAREAREVGIHIALAPVADVNTNPRNPIISIRAFSENPQSAADLVASYVAAAEGRGLLSTAKHFPGHGDTSRDSHDSLPRVDRALKELRECELLPFQAAIDAGCSLVMTAHVAFPKIDASGVPTTLSQTLLQDVLRGEMGFQGVVCSDSLLMAGVRDRFSSEGEMCLAVLCAGVDLLLDVAEPIAVVDYLCECVDRGELSRFRVNEAFGRVWELKRKALRGHTAVIPNPRSLPEGASFDQTRQELALNVATQAIRVFDGDERLPLQAERPLTAILLKPFELPSDPTEQPLAAALRERFLDVRYVQMGPRAASEEFHAAEALAIERPQLVVAMIVKPAAWHAFGLLPVQRGFVERLTHERDTVLVSLGVPYALEDYPRAKVRICTYSDVAVSQRALADFLVGQLSSWT